MKILLADPVRVLGVLLPVTGSRLALPLSSRETGQATEHQSYLQCN